MQCVKCGFFLEPLETVCQKCGYKPGDPLKVMEDERKEVVHRSPAVHPFPQGGRVTLRRNGQKFGPFTVQQINQGLKEKSLTPTDQAQISDHDWVLVRKLEGVTIPSSDPVTNIPYSIALPNHDSHKNQSDTFDPSWTRFTPLSTDEIKGQVSRELTKQTKESKKLESGEDYGFGCLLIIIAFFAWLIPIIGWIISIGAAIIGVLLLFKSFYTGAQSWTAKADEHVVAGQSHNRRNAAQGDCPICNQEIIIYDAVANREVKCPVCTGVLEVSNYMVKPK